MSCQDYQARCKANIERAERILGKHQYTRLTPIDCPMEAWRCKVPDHTNYAFDLVVSRFGIAMFGDTGTLVFNVGAAYGIKFLAGDDVEYYIHSKLEHDLKTTELDEQAFEESKIKYVVSRLERGDKGDDWPAQDGMDCETYRIVLGDWLTAARDKRKGHEPAWDTLDSLANFLDGSASTIQEAHEHFSDSAPDCGFEYDWTERFEQPCQSLIGRLYMLRHAAQQILKIKNPAPGSALAECGSMGEEVTP
jgi:hypothetical protein